MQTFLAALDEVTSLYGRADVSWGEAHRIRKGTVDLPVSGGPGTAGCFRVLEFRKDGDGKLVANSGDSLVFAVEFSQPPKAYTVVAYSQSDVEGSPHFADQAPLFSAGKMKRGRVHRGRDPGAIAQDLSPRRRVIRRGLSVRTVVEVRQRLCKHDGENGSADYADTTEQILIPLRPFASFVVRSLPAITKAVRRLPHFPILSIRSICGSSFLTSLSTVAASAWETAPARCRA